MRRERDQHRRRIPFGIDEPLVDRVQHEGDAREAGAAARDQQRPHPPQLAQALACDLGARRVMPTDPPHQPHRKSDRGKSDQHAGRSEQQARGGIEVRMLLQRQQREVESCMQRDRREKHQEVTCHTRPVAMVAVRAKRGAGARDRKIGARDDAERAVERYGQDAAQRRQGSPHLGMLHEISEVFVSCKTEPRSRPIDHGVHRIGKGPPPPRHSDNDQNLDDLLGHGDAEYRAQGLRQPGIAGNGEQCVEGGPRDAQQRNAGGAEQEGDPDLRRRTRALVGGDDEPQYQQCGSNCSGADHRRKGLKQKHPGQSYLVSESKMATNPAVCKPIGASSGLSRGRYRRLFVAPTRRHKRPWQLPRGSPIDRIVLADRAGMA